ncbi:MAG: hypothetical protein AAF828_11105, partial [Bacteroidota bacterium]
MRRHFPAKVLLFGEHRVLRGGRALAVPFPARGAAWVKKAKVDARLLALVRYLSVHFGARELQLFRLQRDVERGWQLWSNVPIGYGLGSSGTVCAAIWDRYATLKGRNYDGHQLREALARMESFFHGQSSGTDPLVSFLNRPALITTAGIEWIDLPRRWSSPFFLLDTGQARQSGPLVQAFLQRYDTDVSWRQAVDKYWGPADEAC